MAFTFECTSCDWNAGVCDARDVGKKSPEHVCTACGNVDKEREDPKFTTEEFASSEIPCRAGCGNTARLRTLKINSNRPLSAQVGTNEATKVAIHPKTGEVVYCYSKPGDQMPERYAKEGFVEKTFHHYRELEKFCRERGLVNDVEGDYHHNDGYWEEIQEKRSKEESARYERYMEEREKVMSAYPELRRQGR